MIASLFMVLALMAVALIVIAQGGLWGIALFGLAFVTAISGMAE